MLSNFKNRLGRFLIKKRKVSVLGYEIVLNLSIYKTGKNKFSAYHNKTFINVGAGSFSHPDWINVDKISKFYKNKQSPNVVDWDLLSLKPLPFANNSIDLIYSSHVIEHISDEAAKNFFSESFQKLKKGGGIRIVCPDIKYLFDAYKRGDKTLFFPIRDYGKKNQVTSSEYYSLPIIKDASIQQLFLWAFARQASIYHNRATKPLIDKEVDRLFSNNPFEEALDICVQLCDINIQKERPEEHINWWTENKLMKFLKEAGFDTVLRSRYGQSIFPEMRDRRYFDTNCPAISLYVEAIK